MRPQQQREEAHPHQPLQPAPHLARERPPQAGPRRPRRLRLAHDLTDEQILERLLALNLERSAQ
ncbi:MAG TPA: hypothetical protein VGE45_02720 [Chloroflexia bacterium]